MAPVAKEALAATKEALAAAAVALAAAAVALAAAAAVAVAAVALAAAVAVTAAVAAATAVAVAAVALAAKGDASTTMDGREMLIAAYPGMTASQLKWSMNQTMTTRTKKRYSNLPGQSRMSKPQSYSFKSP